MCAILWGDTVDSTNIACQTFLYTLISSHGLEDEFLEELYGHFTDNQFSFVEQVGEKNNLPSIFLFDSIQ